MRRRGTSARSYVERAWLACSQHAHAWRESMPGWGYTEAPDTFTRQVVGIAGCQQWIGGQCTGDHSPRSYPRAQNGRESMPIIPRRWMLAGADSYKSILPVRLLISLRSRCSHARVGSCESSYTLDSLSGRVTSRSPLSTYPSKKICRAYVRENRARSDRPNRVTCARMKSCCSRNEMRVKSVADVARRATGLINDIQRLGNNRVWS